MSLLKARCCCRSDREHGVAEISSLTSSCSRRPNVTPLPAGGLSRARLSCGVRHRRPIGETACSSSADSSTLAGRSPTPWVAVCSPICQLRTVWWFVGASNASCVGIQMLLRKSFLVPAQTCGVPLNLFQSKAKRSRYSYSAVQRLGSMSETIGASGSKAIHLRASNENYRIQHEATFAVFSSSGRAMREFNFETQQLPNHQLQPTPMCLRGRADGALGHLAPSARRSGCRGRG